MNAYSGKLNGYQVVADAYADFGAHVNGHRALPFIGDGLKPVQRRILMGLVNEGGSTKKIVSATVVGSTMGKYHPHGDSSIYGALISMINSRNSLFIGQGSFGGRTLTGNDGAAAMRYTKVKLSEFAKQIFLSYAGYAPTYKNELQAEEAYYYPTPIPYALLAGAWGIGLGTATKIPAIESKLLIKWVQAFLQDQELPQLIPAALGGVLEYRQADLESFNKYGHGTFLFRSKVEKVWSKEYNKDVIRVTDIPSYMNPMRIMAKFRTQIEDGSVIVHDESSDGKVNIVIMRAPYIRTITDEEILEKTEMALSMNIGFRCHVAGEDYKAQPINPHDWMRVTIRRWLKAHEADIRAQLAAVEYEILFNRVKKDLARMLLEQWKNHEIIEGLATRKNDPVELTEEQLIPMLRKTLTTLRGDEVDITKLDDEAAALRKRLKNIKLDALEYLKSKWSLLE